MSEEKKVFKPDTLLMFSGGLDSTGAFWKLVQDGKKVHVHHMNLKNIEKRAVAENQAVQKVLKYMGGVAVFAYSESTHAYPCYNNKFIWDADIASFVAGNICMAMPWIKEVALGMTASDTNPGLQDRIERANKIFNAFGTEAKKVYPVHGMTKQQIYDMIPSELRNCVWSCRTPVYQPNGRIMQCGRCQTCQEVQKLSL